MFPLWLLACTAPGTSDAGDAPVPLDDTATGDTGTPPTRDDESLVVLALNLHCLKTDDSAFDTNAARWAAVAEVVATDAVDVIALQEVCTSTTEDALADLTAAIEAATGTPWSSAWALAHVAWEGTADEADEGVGLLSRRGLTDPTELVAIAPGELRRVALLATLDDGTRVVSVHHDFGSDADREDQSRQVASQALAAAAPGLDVVVAGDFNARPTTPAHTAMLEFGYLDATATLDDSRIDHVFAHRGGRWRPATAALRFTDAPVSDHPGVLATFVDGAGEPVEVTTIDTRIDVGFGSHLAVRGDAAPLSWDRGWWAYPVAADHWRLVLTEPTAAFSIKTLIDDARWQTGEDVVVQPGESVELFPTYE